ncbi:hypothetical protein THER5_1974 [Bifidobacterium thermacidophilum subsp. thermacidophilum]|uniref:Uncharacterized protein n=1 Tax=Bifidobacterium thermacidophilum subsp. thermacidophilum TaxID=79262 RepID=A0A087E6U1_9BIFI|nr:hypothetical protein THER5_1974 [Bifidobacterium thermacidophilum subsp. thermacidophilum]
MRPVAGFGVGRAGRVVRLRRYLYVPVREPTQQPEDSRASERLRRRGRPASAIYAPIPRFLYPSPHNNSKIRAHPRQRGTDAHPNAMSCTGGQTGPPKYPNISKSPFARRCSNPEIHAHPRQHDGNTRPNATPCTSPQT